MSRVCQVTGKRPLVGHLVSHANNKTKRRQMPNLIRKRIWIPEENRWVRVRITPGVLKTINRKGAAAVLKNI